MSNFSVKLLVSHRSFPNFGFNHTKYAITTLCLKRYASFRKAEDYSEYFDALNIPEGSDQLAARESFLRLAKKYHPDSGHAQADSVKFQKIEKSYRKLLEKFSQDRHNSNDCEGEFGLYYNQKRKPESSNEATHNDHDIQHTAPQHRQYLSYEGIGIGTPSQREKQFTKYRAMRAAENIIEYKVQQLSQDKEETGLVAKDKKAAKNIRTRYGIDRIVEDKIQESMAKGDFDNLPNSGKPLKFQNHNPFVDTVTHKLNQVLIENGYAPEWVMLEREIRDDKLRIKKKLENCRCKLGSCPLSPRETVIWNRLQDSLSAEVQELNRKIDKYNLVVPIMTKQTVHFPFIKVGEKILNEGRTKNHKPLEEETPEKSENTFGNLSSHSAQEEFGLKAIISIFKGR